MVSMDCIINSSWNSTRSFIQNHHPEQKNLSRSPSNYNSVTSTTNTFTKQWNNTTLKSNPNTKLKQLVYSHNYYVESVSLLSGHTCPFAHSCMARVDKVTRKIVDGKFAEHRCFSASSEAAFPTVCNARKYNTDLPFDGDSIDREIVRDILVNSRNPT